MTNSAGPGTLPAPFSAEQGARISSCGGAGSNWAINLRAYLDGSNDTYGLNCAPPAGYTAAVGSDVLVVRRANEVRAMTLDLDRIHLQTSRIQGELFVPACAKASEPSRIPSGYRPPVSQSRQLEVHAYYVAQQSTLRDDVPSLRRKVIGNVNSDTTFIVDEEIVACVEHMQVRLGIDTNGDTNIDLYVNPGAVPATARVARVDRTSAEVSLPVVAEVVERARRSGVRAMLRQLEERVNAVADLVSHLRREVARLERELDERPCPPSFLPSPEPSARAHSSDGPLLEEVSRLRSERAALRERIRALIREIDQVTW